MGCQLRIVGLGLPHAPHLCPNPDPPGLPWHLATRADVEPVAVGDRLPEMPLYLEPGEWVPVPLERSYQATWETLPVPLKELIAGEA
jgi:hypothetical protein